MTAWTPSTPLGLGVSPSSLTFTATAGAANPTAQDISLTNGGSAPLTFTATTNVPTWLSVSPGSGTVPDTLSVQPNITGLAAGTYDATVTITPSEGAAQTVSVILTLNPAPSAPAVPTAVSAAPGNAVRGRLVDRPVERGQPDTLVHDHPLRGNEYTDADDGLGESAGHLDLRGWLEQRNRLHLHRGRNQRHREQSAVEPVGTGDTGAGDRSRKGRQRIGRRVGDDGHNPVVQHSPGGRDPGGLRGLRWSKDGQLAEFDCQRGRSHLETRGASQHPIRNGGDLVSRGHFVIVQRHRDVDRIQSELQPIVDCDGFEDSSGVGASQTANVATGAPTVSLTTTSSDSLVYGVGDDWDTAKARTVGTGQGIVDQWVDTGSGDTFWVQGQTNAVPNVGSAVVLNDTAPTTDRWNMTAVEILDPHR